MYLSRLILNPRHRRVQAEVAAPYQLHRSLMNAFPAELPADERVLFRLEQGTHRGGLLLLVQSLYRPDWSWLSEPKARGYLLPVDTPNPEIKEFQPILAIGQLLAFRLRANPTVKRKFSDKRRRVGLGKQEEQIAWLRRKGEAGGFALSQAQARQESPAGGVIHRGQETHRLKLLAVQFDGLLRVTDPDRLVATLKGGIGSGKGLGFGLLSLARPRA